MSDTAIKVENLGKKFSLTHASEEYELFSNVLVDSVKSLLKRFSPGRRSASASTEEFWALDDVSFEIKNGDRVGIIGRNGAGKSTLLKILSRITDPSRGRLTVDGRVASLLEVGTGFHAELTGRENIFLNGAILGMSKQEIKRKFDEIVAFAEVERFLDTPIKRYSSGMSVRLAFAVAAHLEPEILVIDEVLAVGDAQFQQKCLGKMEDVSQQDGRTVLFVSHNMTAVSNLCKRALVLDRGKLKFDGEAQAAIEYYMSNLALPSNELDFSDRRLHEGKLSFSWIHNASLRTMSGEPFSEIRMGEGFKLIYEFELQTPVANLETGFCIENLLGQRYCHFFPEWEGFPTNYGAGRHTLECIIPALNLLPGPYEITIWIKRKASGVDDQVHAACKLTIVGADVNGHKPDFERYPNMGIYMPTRWSKLR